MSAIENNSQPEPMYDEFDEPEPLIRVQNLNHYFEEGGIKKQVLFNVNFR